MRHRVVVEMRDQVEDMFREKGEGKSSVSG